MRKKHFKVGLVILAGLASYFMALSALLVAFAGIPGGSGFGPDSGKTPRIHKDSLRNRTANLSSGGKSPPGSRIRANTGKIKDNPCLSSLTPCDGATFDQSTVGSTSWRAQGPGDSIIVSDSLGDHKILFPAAFGFNMFRTGGAGSGLSGGAGENAGSSQNSDEASPNGAGNITDGTPPGFPGPGQETAPPPIEPNITTSPEIPQFLPSDPLGIEDPTTSTDNTPPDPAPPQPVPEPSTFWLLVGSLTAVAVVLRPARRADYRADRKFCAFFRPATSPQTSYLLSEALVDANKLADVTVAKDILEATNPADTGLLAVNNLKFSQAIYIYHEDSFSTDESARLTTRFARKGIRHFLRDNSYANKRTAEGRNKQPHPIWARFRPCKEASHPSFWAASSAGVIAQSAELRRWKTPGPPVISP